MFVTESEISVDTTVTLSYGLKDRGIGVVLPAWTETFLCSKASRKTPNSSRLSARFLSGALPPAVKRPEIWLGCSPESCVEFRNTWSHTSDHLYRTQHSTQLSLPYCNYFFKNLFLLQERGTIILQKSFSWWHRGETVTVNFWTPN